MQKFPPHSSSEFLFNLILLCCVSAASANSFTLVSYYQVFLAMTSSILSFINGLNNCRIPAPSALESHRQATLLKAEVWVESLFEKLLPVIVSRKSAGPVPGPAPCELINSWAIGTFAYIFPVIVGNMMEERLRREFIKRTGHFVAAPSTTVSILNALVLGILGSRTLWMLLTITISFT